MTPERVWHNLTSTDPKERSAQRYCQTSPAQSPTYPTHVMTFSVKFNLLLSKLNFVSERDLVKISATWKSERTWCTFRNSEATCSLTWCTSISIWIVWLCRIGLLAKKPAPWLSYNTVALLTQTICNLDSRWFNQAISVGDLVECSILRFNKKKATTFCFFELHCTKFPPKDTQWLLVDLLSSKFLS